MLDWLLTHWKSVVFAIWLVYFVLLSGTILLQKRPPLSSIAWILTLSLLPVFGLVIYYIFGPHKIKRHRLSRAQQRIFLHQHQRFWEDRVTFSELDHRFRPLVHLIRQTTSMPPTHATDYAIYSGGEATYKAILNAIDAAEHYVLLSYYIFSPDQTGTTFRDALTRKLRQGVKVFLLVDGMGSVRLTSRFMAEFIEAGGELRYFHQLSLRFFYSLINFRNHRKIVICDGQVAFTGGVNITDAQDLRIDPVAYQDVHMRVEGPIVDWLQTVFLEDWIYVSEGDADLLLYLMVQSDRRRQRYEFNLSARPTVAPVSMQLIPSGPDNELAPTLRVMVEAMHKAERRIWLTTPYFVPDESAFLALTSAALRGVEVKLLVPFKTDTYIVGKAAQSWYEDLIKQGVQVYTYMPRMLHTKTLVVDNDISFIGSANFDYRSFYLNFELSVISYGEQLNGDLAAEFEATLAEAQLVELTKLPLYERLIQAVARLLSPIL